MHYPERKGRNYPSFLPKFPLAADEREACRIALEIVKQRASVHGRCRRIGMWEICLVTADVKIGQSRQHETCRQKRYQSGPFCQESSSRHEAWHCRRTAGGGLPTPRAPGTMQRTQQQPMYALRTDFQVPCSLPPNDPRPAFVPGKEMVRPFPFRSNITWPMPPIHCPVQRLMDMTQFSQHPNRIVQIGNCGIGISLPHIMDLGNKAAVMV